jgi:ElaB/YqjD/DUF883 family membrane-anchored ribosome-binding protein
MYSALSWPHPREEHCVTEATEDIREEMARTRTRMTDTIEALERRVQEPIESAKERLNLFELARQHPWPALGVALLAGFAVAATRADAKLVSAAADAAKDASGKLVDAVKEGIIGSADRG